MAKKPALPPFNGPIEASPFAGLPMGQPEKPVTKKPAFKPSKAKKPVKKGK